MWYKHVWLDVSWSIIYPSLHAMFIECSNCFGRVLNQHSVCVYIAYIWEGNRYSALFNLKCIRAKANRWTQLFITAHCHDSISDDLTSEGRANPIIENALLDWHSKMMCTFHLFSCCSRCLFCFTPVLFLIFCPSVADYFKHLQYFINPWGAI